MSSVNPKEAFVSQKTHNEVGFNGAVHLSKDFARFYRRTTVPSVGAWESMLRADPLKIPIILGSARDTGETNVVGAVTDEFQRRQWVVEIMATGAGLPLLETRGYMRNPLHDALRSPEDIKRTISNLTGDALVLGFSGEDNLAAAMSARASAFGIDEYRVEDFSGALGKNMHDYYGAEFELFAPHKVFVANPWAAAENARYFHENSIEVVGAPNIPALDLDQQARTRADLRDRLGIPQDRLVVGWFGQVGGATVEAMKIFLKGLNTLQEPFDLLVRFHPTFIREGDYKIALPLLEPFGEKVKHVSGLELPGVKHERIADVNDVLDAVDIAGNERSTVATQAAARRRLMISLDLEGIAEKYHLDYSFKVPAIERGASPVVRRSEEMAGVLQNALYNGEARAEYFKAMREFESDGLGAWNIVNVIESDLFRQNRTA